MPAAKQSAQPANPKQPTKRPWFGSRWWQKWRWLQNLRKPPARPPSRRLSGRLAEVAHQQHRLDEQLHAARTAFSQPETQLTQAWQAKAYGQSTRQTSSILHQGLLKAWPLWQKNRKQALKALEEALLKADVGLQTTKNLLNPLRVTPSLSSAKALETSLRQALYAAFQQPNAPLHLPAGWLKKTPKRAIEPVTSTQEPVVWIFLGVNGVGKTTSLGKVAFQLQQAGLRVMLVAGDAFRAAATEQLAVWAKRAGCSFYAAKDSAPPSQVIYQGIAQAKAQNIDLVLCDTAGRLHTNHNLMAELKGMCRAAAKVQPGAPHETLLVVDANTGQNALRQAQSFDEAVQLTGLLVTKLEGSAKGGVLVGLVNQFSLPIRWVGMGEGIEDLHPFEATHFVAGLLE